MATLEERVAYIEGQMAEQSHAFLAMRELLKEIGQRIDRVDQRIDRVDQRLDRLEQRMEARFEAVDRRFETIDHRFIAIEEKMSRQFLWIVGIQITTLIAVVGAVLSRG